MAEDKILNEFVDASAAETEDAVADLERIEEEVAQEAENAVELEDDLGDAQAAAEAAETAFDFEAAKEATEEIKHEL